MRVTKGGRVSELLAAVPIPPMFRARQVFPRPRIERGEIPAAVFRELSKPGISDRIRPGASIAITAGSRGVANVDAITRSIVDFARSRGARPFVVPAMGSHGGATAEGQREILAGYGITEEAMGCPVRSLMDAVRVGLSATGRPVYFDRLALESDGVIVSCRVKPHNAFRGTYESGICKMIAVGLGKREGAESAHRDGMGKIGEHIPSMAAAALETAPVIAALACVENAYDETFLVEAIPSEKILSREPELLSLAFANMPRILVGEAEVLIVDEIGKNYSGTGVDPNVTGTFSTEFATGGLKVQRTCMLDLSEASNGNGLGAGLASAITKRLFEKLDAEAMYPNCLTSTVLRSAMVPLVAADDREAIQACLLTLNGAEPASACVVRIANSLHVERIMLSESYFEDVAAGRYPGLEALDEPRALAFDAAGDLTTAIA